jgi:hypothetical protein
VIQSLAQGHGHRTGCAHGSRWLALAPVLLLLATTLCGCHSKRSDAASPTTVTASATEGCPTTTCREIRVVRSGLASACEVNGRVGPVSYEAKDVDTIGPDLFQRDERSLTHRVAAYVHSRTLRIARVGGQFIIFDANQGICSGGMYPVLNAGCSLYYSPTDFDGPNATGVAAGIIVLPGPCDKSPRPWQSDSPA